MLIMPVKELKDGARISQLCHETNEPIHITKNGYADMVIMSSEAYDALERRARMSDASELVLAGVQAAREGKAHDARSSLEAIRAKYGI